MFLLLPSLNFPPLPLSFFPQVSSSSSSVSSPAPFLPLFQSLFISPCPLPPPTSDPTKKLCTVPHNEVRRFHMLMLLLPAQRAAQGKKQSCSEKQGRGHTHVHAGAHTHTHAAGMATVQNELPLSCLQLQ